MSNKRLIVVDDEEEQLIIMRLLLSRAGYDVIVASSVQQAYDHIAQSQPAVLICDYRMPDEDEGGFIFEIKKRFPTATFPIVLCSARATETIPTAVKDQVQAICSKLEVRTKLIPLLQKLAP